MGGSSCEGGLETSVKEVDVVMREVKAAMREVGGRQ